MGMEKFGARKEKPIDTCMNEVTNSDIFIAIIGMRYGSVDRISGKSFTQIEYEQAVKLNKEIIIYLINEQEALIRPNYIDFENYHKLQEFKRKLKNNHTVDFFKNEEELVRKLNIKLLQLLPSSKKKTIRPKTIECSITRFTVSKESWIIVTGYNYGHPIEIYIFRPKDHFDIPKYITKGKIIQRKDNFDKHVTHFDLQYLNKDGYKITSEGISASSRIATGKLNKILSKLLINEVSIDAIIEIIPEFNLDNIKNMNSFKRGLKKALLIK